MENHVYSIDDLNRWKHNSQCHTAEWHIRTTSTNIAGKENGDNIPGYVVSLEWGHEAYTAFARGEDYSLPAAIEKAFRAYAAQAA